MSVVAIRKREFVSMIKEPANRTFTWKTEHHSKLDKKFYSSQEFTVELLKWYYY